MKWTASLLLTMLLVAVSATAFAGPASASTKSPPKSIFEVSKDKLKISSVKSGLGDPTKVQSGVSAAIGDAINTAVGFLGVIAVILIIYAGGLWMTAAGSEEKVKKAKQIIKSTVIGIVIVGFAYAITAFVISQVAKQQAPAVVPTDPVPTKVE